MVDLFANPFRPGAGHRPPYLAGRREEKEEFRKLLRQTVITDNLVLTGLRGVGKTVLLEELKPMAVADGWLWVGTDLSESASISEVNLAQRLIAERPELRVLFISGYADVAGPFATDSPNVSFLGKPFQASVLVERVRELLGRPRAAAGAQ